MCGNGVYSRRSRSCQVGLISVFFSFLKSSVNFSSSCFFPYSGGGNSLGGGSGFAERGDAAELLSAERSLAFVLEGELSSPMWLLWVQLKQDRAPVIHHVSQTCFYVH